MEIGPSRYKIRAFLTKTEDPNSTEEHGIPVVHNLKYRDKTLARIADCPRNQREKPLTIERDAVN
jgi:hypothetical protein